MANAKRQTKAVQDAEAMANERFAALRAARKLASDLFAGDFGSDPALMEDATLGLYERVMADGIVGDAELTAEIIGDIERSRDLARELFGKVTPTATFEIFDIAFVGDDD